MTEEINNLNTDLKELFSENKLDELYDKLDGIDGEIVTEITLYNYDIIKKYYDTEKYSLIIQYIRFVAFTSFLCEYSFKRDLFTEERFKEIMTVYENIFQLLQESK